MSTRAHPSPPNERGAAPRRAEPPRGRDRYVDTLRALALTRVVLYHLFGFIWLPIVFPSMSILFGIGGSFMAASLDRGHLGHRPVLRRRLRRLLMPFWAFGALVVPVMVLVDGWRPELLEPLLWLLPVAPPPGSESLNDWALPLWYISTYFWFVLISPALLWLFRRWPKRTLAVPTLIIIAWAVGLLTLPGPGGRTLLLVSTYAACWMLGFAHHDGKLQRWPLWLVVPLGLGMAAFGLWYAITFPDPVAGPNVSDVTVATMFYGSGVTLIALRLQFNFDWLSRVPPLDLVVSAINQRAVTIYLWGNVAISGAWALANSARLSGFYYGSGVPHQLLVLLTTWALIAAAVLMLGWVEDVAARRRPRLVPTRVFVRR